jgi:ribosomal protein S18 acetylase RimI-like enzyme
MNDIHIRPAQVSDSERILAMLKQLASDTGDDDIFRCRSEDIARHGFGDQPLFHSLIAARGDIDLGLAVYHPIFSTTRGMPGVFLLDLWVSAEARNLGLGKQLMEQVVSRAQQQWQAAYLLLMVHGHNDDAQRFYQRHGFSNRPDDQYLFLEGDAFQAMSAWPETGSAN